MADETQNAPDAPVKPAAPAAPSTPAAAPAARPAAADAAPPASSGDGGGEPSFSVEEWRARSRQFGVSPHAITGALFGADAQQRYTEDEVRSKLDEFTTRPGVSEGS